MSNIVFFDLEVGKNGKILDIGAVDQDGKTFHSSILHIVYWKYEETQGEQSKWYEIPIILPELYLKKSNRNASGIEYEHFTQRIR